MTPHQYWYENPQHFYNYADSYNNRIKMELEKFDYLAWRTGESVKSALETTAILSLMVDGKDAKKALRNAKYQEAPAFVLMERKGEKASKRELTDEEILEQRERLFNYINKIKPKK